MKVSFIHRLIYVFLIIKCIISTVKIYYLESLQIFRDLRLYDLLGKSKQLPVSERKCPNRRYLFKNQPSIETFVTEMKICTETCVVIVGCYKISEFEFQKYFHLVISGKQFRLIECYYQVIKILQKQRPCKCKTSTVHRGNLGVG